MSMRMGNETGVPSMDWMGSDLTPLWDYQLQEIQEVEAEFTPRRRGYNPSGVRTMGLILARRKAHCERLEEVARQYTYAMVLLRLLEKGVL